MSTKGINKLKQVLTLRYCPTTGNCDPPLILEREEKVWTNVQRSTHAEINVLTTYTVNLPEPPPYIRSESSKVGIDKLTISIIGQRGMYCSTFCLI